MLVWILPIIRDLGCPESMMLHVWNVVIIRDVLHPYMGVRLVMTGYDCK